MPLKHTVPPMFAAVGCPPAARPRPQVLSPLTSVSSPPNTKPKHVLRSIQPAGGISRQITTPSRDTLGRHPAQGSGSAHRAEPGTAAAFVSALPTSDYGSSDESDDDFELVGIDLSCFEHNNRKPPELSPCKPVLSPQRYRAKRKLLLEPSSGIGTAADSGTESQPTSDREDSVERPRRATVRISLTRPELLAFIHHRNRAPIPPLQTETKGDVHHPATLRTRTELHTLPQMFESIEADDFTDDDGDGCIESDGWVCDVCTVKNFKKDAPVCEVCRSRRSDSDKASLSRERFGIPVARNQDSIQRVARRWKISDRDAAEIMMNFELANPI